MLDLDGGSLRSFLRLALGKLSMFFKNVKLHGGLHCWMWNNLKEVNLLLFFFSVLERSELDIAFTLLLLVAHLGYFFVSF